MVHEGGCFCGAVKIEARGEPLAMGYCHCQSCRAWSGSPVTSFVLWKPEAVRVVAGQDQLATFARTEFSHRQFCRQCGGHVMAAHPSIGLFDVLAPILPSLEFKPTFHVNYGETVLPMKDGLPKFRDFPAEDGGSGDIVGE